MLPADVEGRITIVSCLRIWALVKFDQTTNPTYDNVSGIYWCVTECNLFIVVACMPAMHSIVQRLLGVIESGGLENGKGKSSKDNYASEGRSRESYIRHELDNRFQHNEKGNLPFGVIAKSMDVSVIRTQVSQLDIERAPGRLRPDCMIDTV